MWMNRSSLNILINPSNVFMDDLGYLDKGLDNFRVDFLSAELVFYQRDFLLGD